MLSEKLTLKVAGISCSDKVFSSRNFDRHQNGKIRRKVLHSNKALKGKERRHSFSNPMRCHEQETDYILGSFTFTHKSHKYNYVEMLAKSDKHFIAKYKIWFIRTCFFDSV